MKQLIILIGPSCSGKSTYYKELLKTNPYFYEVNQDDQGKGYYKEVFLPLILTGNNICVTRMNFDVNQRKRFIEPAKKAGYTIKGIVLHENKETLLKRGLNRLKNDIHPTVKTEQDLHSAVNFFFKSYERPTMDEGFDVLEFRYPKKPLTLNCAIFDIDGTMADCDHRLHFVKSEKKDWKNFLHPENVRQDKLNEWCRMISNSIRPNTLIIMCSGRTDNLRGVTKEWLEEHKVFHDELFMRPRDDHRKDDIIKEIILDFEILTRYNMPLFAIDDRQSIVDLWRRRGIKTLQCSPGNF